MDQPMRIAAAVAVRLPHDTWVLDDGARPEVERVAQQDQLRPLLSDKCFAQAIGKGGEHFGRAVSDLAAAMDVREQAVPCTQMQVGQDQRPEVNLVLPRDLGGLFHGSEDYVTMVSVPRQVRLNKETERQDVGG